MILKYKVKETYAYIKYEINHLTVLGSWLPLGKSLGLWKQN